MTTPPKISLQNVHKAFGDKKVLRGINLDVAKGESVVIIGGSGTGKSVTLKCILGLIKPDQGDVLIDGTSVLGFKGRARDAELRKFGMLFQSAALFDSLTVWENVAFGLRQTTKISKSDAKDRAIACLKRVGMDGEVADLNPNELSGGMRKRVGLARAIAYEPEIIFFDEPTTGLDPIMADVINDLIVELVEELGVTTLTITHDMASARKIADDVAMLYKGQIIWRGAVDGIDHSNNAYVDQFINGHAHGPITMDLLKP